KTKGWSYKYDFIPSVLGCNELGADLPVAIRDIKDGTSHTAVLTDKFVYQGDVQGFKSSGDVEFASTGAATTLRYKPNITAGQKPPPPAFVGLNTKRYGYSMVPDDAWGYAYYASSYNSYLGSSHVAQYQPVAFADGSVRNFSYLGTAFVGIN